VLAVLLSGLLAAIRICPLAATKKTPWPSQSVTGFASRRTAALPERCSAAQCRSRLKGSSAQISRFCLWKRQTDGGDITLREMSASAREATIA
jgi:hypothetical protein